MNDSVNYNMVTGLIRMLNVTKDFENGYDNINITKDNITLIYILSDNDEIEIIYNISDETISIKLDDKYLNINGDETPNDIITIVHNLLKSEV